MKEFEMHTMPNGIRVLHKEVNTTKLAHCGFMLDIGSRDENKYNQGIAHFWEHMAFKGTNKRKAFHILNRIDSVGGELNAYTTKEKIAFYASVLETHFEKAFELLTDIMFHSVFPEKQIEKERNVILEEMSMYLDAPEDAIQDEFDDVVFSDHPLGMNILGTINTVSSFGKKDFLSFVEGHMNTEKIIFCSVGNVPFKKVVRLATKYLNDIPAYSANTTRKAFTDYQPTVRTERRAMMQAHCAIGRNAYAINSQQRIPFFMLTNILGGPGMNSRLNLALREKHGLVYSIEATHQSYLDTGLFSIFFGTEYKNLQRSIQLVYKELKKLREVSLGTVQLHTAKEQLMGQLAMADENNVGLMLMMGKSMLDLGRIHTLDSIYAEIRKVTANDIQDMAHEMFQEDQLSMLTYTPN